MARTLASAALVVCLCTTFAPIARADAARAEELIRRANDLRRQSKGPEALPLFREAYQIARSPRTAAQLGLVELSLGYWLDAESHLLEALAPQRHPWIDSGNNRQVLEQSLAQARSHIGSLDIAGSPAGAEVTINGRRAGNFPLPGPMKLSEGDFTIEVRAPGHRSVTRNVNIHGGASQREVFALEPSSSAVAHPPAPPPPPPPSPSPSPGLRRWLPWTLAAGSALAGGVAVWQHVEWRGAQSDFEANRACYTSHSARGDDPACAGLYDTLAGHRRWAIVGYSVAGALAIGAAVTYVLGDSGSESEAPRAAFGPGPTPLGLSYTGGF